MNAARELYLGPYSRIDSINHLIKNHRLKYRSWKYWHLPMLHAMSLAIVVAYNIYLELAQGKQNPDWKVIYSVDLQTFRDLLSIQMLEYDQIKRKFPGGAGMRRCTSQKRKDQSANNKDSQSIHDTRQSTKKNKRGRPTPAMMRLSKFCTKFLKAKDAHGDNSWLYGNLSSLNKYLRPVETSLKHPKACKVCGGDAYSECKICGVFLHTMPVKGKNAGKTCFLIIRMILSLV